VGRAGLVLASWLLTWRIMVAALAISLLFRFLIAVI
jgi:hypothetical protein